MKKTKAQEKLLKLFVLLTMGQKDFKTIKGYRVAKITLAGIEVGIGIPKGYASDIRIYAVRGSKFVKLFTVSLRGAKKIVLEQELILVADVHYVNSILHVLIELHERIQDPQ